MITTVSRDEVTLSFSITGDDPTAMTWYFNASFGSNAGVERQIQPDDSRVFSQDMLSLTIMDISRADEGTYRLSAINEGGANDDTVTVMVQGI